jgi:Fur family ferric uptake transcriptional regulator
MLQSKNAKDLQILRGKIMQNGYKTKSREYILEYFKGHKEQIVSAADIHRDLQENGKQINLATIYRNLDKMTEDGVLLKYKTAKDEHAVFQFVGEHEKCHEHLHLQCVKCGKVIHLECCFMKDIVNHLEEHHGFMLECSNSVLYGLCRDCR